MFHIEFSTLVIILLLVVVAIITFANIHRKRVNKKLSKLNKELAENREKYKLVVENSPDIMFIQKEGKLLFANTQFIKMSGYSMNELKDKSIYDFVDEEHKEIVSERARLRQMGHAVIPDYEVKTINRFGKQRFFNLKMSFTMHNGEHALLGVGTDVSSKKKGEETIRKLSIAMEQSPASVFIFDNEGVIEYANKSFLTATAYNRKEAIGLNVSELNPVDLPIKRSEKFWEIISSGQTWKGEIQTKKKGGEVFWENASVTPIFNSSGAVTHYSSVSQDISTQKDMLARLMENELKLKEANATKDRFFSIIAHDLRNPFNAIMGYASLLQSQFDVLEREERIEYIENINTAAESTYCLLENILEWSRSQKGKLVLNPEKFDLSTLVNEIILLSKAQADSKNIRLRSKVKFQTYVFADENMIKTVLRNLVSNAIKYTKKGEVLIETETSSSKIMISVIDTGVGISDETFSKLFKIDEKVSVSGTENEKGTGLGLILSKEFVNKNGGEIWVNRMKDQGTIFNFTLPVI